MKRLRNLLTVVMILAMILTLSVTALAASDGSVTIDNATVGETYKIYKVFDLTYSGVGETSTGAEGGDPLYSGVAYTYTKTSDPDNLYNALIGTGSPFTLTATTTPNVYQVTSTATATEISAWLKTNESLLTEAATEVTATSATVKWIGLAYGYYYITSTVGSTVTIDSTLKDVTVKDKNTVPTQDKKQLVGAGTYTDDDQYVQVGDTVSYQIEVKDGKGTDKAITITDTMTNGLTYTTDSVTVFESIAGGAESTVDPAKYTLTQNATSFKLVLNDTYVKTLTEADKVYIRYSATVNTAAATDDDATKETNTSTMAYATQSTTETVNVITKKFQLDKTDATYNDLLGAKFELYRGTVDPLNKVKFSAGTPEGGIPVLIVDPTSGTIEEIDLTTSAKVIIKGLDNVTYVLRETQAPSGYNKAADTNVANTTTLVIDGTITDNTGIATDTGVVTVVNNTGKELPSTGGIGTTIFYIIGGVLVVGAGVLLITKKRMKADED